MTHHTEVERAAFELDWKRRHHPLPMNTRLHDDGRYGDPIIQGQWETWQAARRAPAAPVPNGWTDDQMISFAWMILNQGGAHCDSIEERIENFRGNEKLRGNTCPAAAPQPPEAAPVQMPEKNCTKQWRRAMQSEPKPCPFCGGCHIGVETTESEMFEAFCYKCGSSGQLCKSESAAIAAWNRRAPEGEEQ